MWRASPELALTVCLPRGAKGEHLGGTVLAGIDADGNTFACTPTSDAVNETQISCKFPADIPAGDYVLFANAQDCGFAANVPSFTLTPTDPPPVPGSF